MATKQQIFEKLTTLLQDINDQFAQLENSSTVSDDLKGDLFEATVSYFAAHVSIYNRLLKNESSRLPESEEEEILFTPAIDAGRERALHAEQIQEVSAEDGKALSDNSTADTAAEEGEVTVSEVDAEGAVLPDAGVEVESGEEDSEEEEQESDQLSVAEVGDDENQDASYRAETSDIQENAAYSDETEVKQVVNEVTIANKEVQVAPESERPARPLSLNERISAQRRGESTGVHPLLSTQRGDTERVTDIKSAISLNDKLLFIKDLFNGYSLAYSEAIELLNRYDDFASADAFLQANYAKKNNWADKPAAVDKLYAVLRKRFG
jgi:AAA ATPase containing von Willebrand factor type A (vWA) domain